MIQSVNVLPPQPIEPPSGIGTIADIMRVQRALGVKDDGIWGPITQAAYEEVHIDSFANELAKAVKAANDAARQEEIDAQLDWKMNYAVDVGATNLPSSATDDAAYLESILQQNAIMIAQGALGVSPTGQWDAATRNAYNNNPNAVTTGIYNLDGTQKDPNVTYEVLSGNVRRPWANEEERIRINNEFAAMYGFAGYDGCGGIFSKTGMSSNPYFVQDKTGLTREQLNAAGLSSVPDAVLGSDLWRQGFLNLTWNGFSTVGIGMQWPPTLYRVPKTEGEPIFRGLDNGAVNWQVLLSAQPSTTLGRPVASALNTPAITTDTDLDDSDFVAVADDAVPDGTDGSTWTTVVV